MAVTLADIRTRVSKVLKRGAAVKTEDLDEWISDGVRRIQRTLRTPLDLASAEATVPAGWNGHLSIPGNLLNLHSIQVDGQELTMRAVSDVKRAQSYPSPNAPTMYCVEVGTYLIAPIPQAGSKITVIYTADAYGELNNPTISLKLFDVAADLVTYAALIRAADWSLDDARLAKWNNIYNVLFAELQDMADRDDLNNAVINTPYTTNGTWQI